MDPMIAPFVSSSRKVDEEEALDLLEEFWFFNNLLNRKARIFRSNSDPIPCTTSFGHETSIVGEVIENNGGGNFLDLNLDQESSPILCTEEGEEGIRNKERDLGLGMRKLIRTPSLPISIGRKEVLDSDNESDRDLSKLIRQATINPPGSLPPRSTSTSKGTQKTQPRRRITRAESINMSILNETRQRYLNHQRKTMKKSLIDLEIEEVQGFKDLGFKFDKIDLNQSVVKILPGLQERNRVEPNNVNTRRPYLSEAWITQNSAPPIPSWVIKKSEEDMKTHIKFWARSVASNAR